MLVAIQPIAAGDTSNSTRAADRTFTFTRKAMATIINGHSKAYEPILFHPSSFKGRWIVEARRRQIDHLVVVAGPTGVGKSTFIEALNAPSMRERFGIEGSFETIQANALDGLRTGPIATLVYHYDMLRPFDRPLHSHGRDPAFHLLASAKRITLVTLWEPVTSPFNEPVNPAELPEILPEILDAEIPFASFVSEIVPSAIFDPASDDDDVR